MTTAVGDIPVAPATPTVDTLLSGYEAVLAEAREVPRYWWMARGRARLPIRQPPWLLNWFLRAFLVAHIEATLAALARAAARRAAISPDDPAHQACRDRLDAFRQSLPPVPFQRTVTFALAVGVLTLYALLAATRVGDVTFAGDLAASLLALDARAVVTAAQRVPNPASAQFYAVAPLLALPLALVLALPFRGQYLARRLLALWPAGEERWHPGLARVRGRRRGLPPTMIGSKHPMALTAATEPRGMDARYARGGLHDIERRLISQVAIDRPHRMPSLGLLGFTAWALLLQVQNAFLVLSGSTTAAALSSVLFVAVIYAISLQWRTRRWEERANPRAGESMPVLVPAPAALSMVALCALLLLRAADWPGSAEPRAQFAAVRIVDRNVTYAEAQAREITTLDDSNGSSADPTLQQQDRKLSDQNRAEVEGVVLAFEVRTKNLENCRCLLSWMMLDDRRQRKLSGWGWYPARGLKIRRRLESVRGEIWVPLPAEQGRYAVRLGVRTLIPVRLNDGSEAYASRIFATAQSAPISTPPRD